MENTWASGAIELLKHADSHIHLESAFDRRIAFISLDNCVETSIRTFLSLPKSKSGISIKRKDLEDAENSFPRLLSILWDNAAGRLTGLDGADIEHYHRIRNKLYHDGTGLSVDEQYLMAYRQIAVTMLNNLFGVAMGEPKPAPTLERLIALWNKVEEEFKRLLESENLDRSYTFFWEEAMQLGVLTIEDIQNLTELRMIRNKQVRSLELDEEQVKYAIHLAEKILVKITKD